MEFHSLGAEHDNEPSYSLVSDLGTCNVPFSDDLRLTEWMWDIGFSRSVIYSSIKLLSAL